MVTVFKYPIKMETGYTQLMSLPYGATILHVAIQADMLYLWAEVDTERAMEDHMFRVYGTGEKHSPLEHHKYLGTVHDGAFAWHLYELFHKTV